MPTKPKQRSSRKAGPEPQPGFDPGFRPASYWEDLGPMQAMLGPIKEEHRRRRIMEALKSGDELPDGILDPEFPEDLQKALERIHPAYMGGAYLPALEPGEVEIARVSLASVTADVISLRARPSPAGGIDYRVVDEYDTDYQVPGSHSDRPLTLLEIFQMLEGTVGQEELGGLVTGSIQWHLQEGTDDFNLRAFVSVSSTFYPELGALCEGHIRQVMDDWEAAHAAGEDE